MRKLRIAGRGPDDWIRIADKNGKIVCTLPRTEKRLALFVVRAVNLFGFGLRPYDRNDWLRERNLFQLGKPQMLVRFTDEAKTS